MPLEPGLQLGPYVIVAPIGAGGMGEVYRARDTRLDRDVAVKVLPPAVAGAPEALARFEREARAVAALSHPNILTIHDFGQAAGTTYAVTELLEGETLRARMAGASMPARKAVDIGVQIARGLAAAHDRQIVHRDLKPDNVFITAAGGVKILDFGLARSALVSAALTQIDSPTVAPGTEPGTVMGTVGYMAPEQVRGETVDHRADIFALGCVLFEMVTGCRPFHRDTAAETMTAILRDDPAEPTAPVNAPPGLLRTIRRCLEKRPEERFQSARDLAFALENALDSSGSSPATPVRVRDRRAVPSILVLALGLLIGAAAAVAVARGSRPAAPARAAAPAFKRLTFERGTVREARFAPDGRTVIYGAAWDGHPVRTYLTRTDTPGAVPVNVPDGQVLSISRTGEMALSLGHRFEGWMGVGTLARSSLLGGTPRPILEGVREADWTPDGSDLAVVRRMDGVERLELPVGRVLHQTSGYISDIRFSPSGDRIAFADHPLYADDAGALAVVDRSGNRRVLAQGFNSIRGVAWTPDGREVWFTAGTGEDGGNSSLLAVTLAGERRVLLAGPFAARLFDIAPDGRVLLANDAQDRRVEALLAGDSAPREVTFRESSTSGWIAPDGTAMTLSDQAAPGYAAYLLRPGDASPLRLGRGQAYGMSPDGRWVAALPAAEPRVLLHSPSAIESIELPNPEQVLIDNLAWLPDSSGIVFFGQPLGRASRGYIQKLGGGPPRAFTSGNVTAISWWSLPVAPDGTRVLGRDAAGRSTIYHLDGSAPEPLLALDPRDLPVQWATDRTLLVGRSDGRGWSIARFDLSTGQRQAAFEITPRELAGLRLSHVSLAQDGRHFTHSYSRLLSALYVVEGLR